jgi:hypothetical protein
MDASTVAIHDAGVAGDGAEAGPYPARRVESVTSAAISTGLAERRDAAAPARSLKAEMVTGALSLDRAPSSLQTSVVR